MFLSAKSNNVRAILQDKAFCAVTTDGGLSFRFLSWMTPQDSVRSVMPSTVEVAKGHLISALRRRLDPPKGEKYALATNWIDVVESTDNGQSWHFLHKIAETDNGIRNGNPPSLVRARDGILAVIYGVRAVPYGIRARVSRDNGKTWSREIILRDDAATWDIGYVKSVAGPDGKVVSVFYYSTDDMPERHIEAVIWDPAEIHDSMKQKDKTL